MANKKNKKKDAQASKQPAAAASKAEAKKVPAKKVSSAAKKPAKSNKNAKPGLIARAKNYIRSVKSEMKRVVWPTKKELINYSVTVCVSLIVVGVVIALLDVAIGEGLVLFSGLRG